MTEMCESHIRQSSIEFCGSSVFPQVTMTVECVCGFTMSMQKILEAIFPCGLHTLLLSCIFGCYLLSLLS
jgi:hypothetical protein